MALRWVGPFPRIALPAYVVNGFSLLAIAAAVAFTVYQVLWSPAVVSAETHWRWLAVVGTGALAITLALSSVETVADREAERDGLRMRWARDVARSKSVATTTMTTMTTLSSVGRGALRAPSLGAE